MSSPIQISDDDDSFSPMDVPDVIGQLVSDDTAIFSSTDDEFDSDLPAVNLNAKKSAVIKRLFPTTAQGSKYNVPSNEPSTENKTQVHVSSNDPILSEPKNLGTEMQIAGLKVNLPLKPYPSQVALLLKVKIFIYK